MVHLIQLCKQNQQDALFFIYIYSIIFISTLHVSNDHIVHNQEFSLFIVFTALYKIVQTCPVALVFWLCHKAVNTVNNENSWW